MPSIPSVPKVQHLFLLVGENPLPNYVAAQLLTAPGSTIDLVHSSGTHEQSQQLRALLVNAGWERAAVTSVPVVESDAAEIYSKVRDRVIIARRACKSVGLHYTGGTKAMSVHAYRAVADVEPEGIFSYLDARTREVRIHRADGATGPLPVIGDLDAVETLHLSVEDLLNLHGLAVKVPGRPEPILPQTTNAIANLFVRQVVRNRRDENDVPPWKLDFLFGDGSKIEAGKHIKALTTEHIVANEVKSALIADAGAGEIALDELADNYFTAEAERRTARGEKKSPADVFVQWLRSLWLEDFVVSKLASTRATGDIQDLAAGVEVHLARNRKFEIDAAASRGYQLFVFSCTTERKQDKCKEKLLEAVLRAEQMGGGEARAAVVCGFDDPEKLLAEVVPYVPERRVRVFGPSTFRDLDRHFRDWFRAN